MITEEIKQYIRDNFHYNHITGDLWRNFHNYYKIVGYFNDKKYLQVSVKCNMLKVHRVAWFLYYGEFPVNQIDHIDRNRSNNKIQNLREVTHDQNMLNKSMYHNSSTKLVGVSWHKTNKKYRAYIGFETKIIHIGYYSTAEEASAAYQKKAAELFGEFNPHRL